MDGDYYDIAALQAAFVGDGGGSGGGDGGSGGTPDPGNPTATTAAPPTGNNWVDQVTDDGESNLSIAFV